MGDETQAYRYWGKMLCVVLNTTFIHRTDTIYSGPLPGSQVSHIQVHLTELHPIGGGDIDNASGLAYQAVPAWCKLN